MQVIPFKNNASHLKWNCLFWVPVTIIKFILRNTLHILKMQVCNVSCNFKFLHWGKKFPQKLLLEAEKLFWIFEQINCYTIGNLRVFYTLKLCKCGGRKNAVFLQIQIKSAFTCIFCINRKFIQMSKCSTKSVYINCLQYSHTGNYFKHHQNSAC